MNKSELLPALLVYTGLAVLVGALPIGLCAGIVFFGGDWYPFVVSMAAGTFAATIVGGSLFALGVVAAKPLWSVLHFRMPRDLVADDDSYGPESRQYIASAS